MLEDYGWSETLQDCFTPYTAEGLLPARVVAQQRGLYRLATSTGGTQAKLSGRYLFTAGNGDHPVPGDWVAISLRDGEEAATIHHLLPRRSAFVRKAAGTMREAQIAAANIDIVLIVTSLNSDLNMRRLERTLAIAWESGAVPAVILTKADLCDDADARLHEVASVAIGARVLAVSAVTGEGMAELKTLVPKGVTAVVLGSSGVGKSTLVNTLAGEDLMTTNDIRASDERGRHTTTHRELILLPEAGCILDTPGMRELGLWEIDTDLSTTFADIEALARQCRFKDCAHGAEPDCAVRQALDEGILDQARWRSYYKLQRELFHLGQKENKLAITERKKREAKLTRTYRSKPDSREE